MSLDGNGTYSPPAPQFPAISNTVIYADDFNQIILDIATALSTAIFRDGQAAFTANQSMGGNKLTNLANGVNPQDAVTFLQVFTDPNISTTTAEGMKVTGAAITISVLHANLAGATQVTLPANTSIGTVSAAEIAVLDGLTASTDELNVLDGITASTAELNILDGVTATAAELNTLDGIAGDVQGQLNLKAPLASPALTGIPTAPTAAPGTNSTQVATTEFAVQLAFQTATPVQNPDGNPRWLRSQGGIASWEFNSPDLPLMGMGIV